LIPFLQQTWKLAQENIQAAQITYAAQYNQDMNPHSFSIGDFVLISTPKPKKGISPKLQRHWIGPYKVLEVNAQNLKVTLVGGRNPQPETIHVSRCKPAPPEFISDDKSQIAPPREIIPSGSNVTYVENNQDTQAAESNEVPHDNQFFTLRNRLIPKTINSLWSFVPNISTLIGVRTCANAQPFTEGSRTNSERLPSSN
jgi:hypothetical protein